MAENVEESYREKRKVARKYLVFYLRVFDGLSTNVLGHVINLSSKGLMLLSDTAIPVNEDYRLRMKLPTEACERDEVIFSAISRWGKRDVNPDFFLTGFQIFDLAARDQNQILNLLDEFSFLGR